MRRTLATVLVLACLLGIALPRARAGGFHLSTIGGSRTSMTTNIARPDDATALLHNPAGLALQTGVRAHLSASVPFMEMGFKLKALDPARYPEINPDDCQQQPGGCPWPVGPDGYYEQRIAPDKIFGLVPFAAVSSDLSFIAPARGDMVLALGVYSPNFFGAFLPSEAPTAYHMIEGMFLVITTSVGWAWRVNRYLSVGAVVSYNNMRLSLAQKLSTVDALSPRGAPPTALGQAGQMVLGDLRMDFVGHDHGFGWQLGLLFNPVPMLTIGVTYNGATTANFRGDVEVQALGTDDPALLGDLLTRVGYKLPRQLEVEIAIPHTLGAGVMLHLAPWLSVGFDCRFWLYNLVEQQRIAPIYADGPGKEPMTEASMSKVKLYNMSYQLSWGVSARPLASRPDLELMAGFIYDMSPVPDTTFSLDNPSMNYVAPACGVRMVLASRWRITLSYMLLFYLERDVTDSRTNPPTNVVGSGTNHLPGVDLEVLF